MHRAKALALAPWLLLVAVAGAADFSGQNALDYTRKVVDFGERPAGSIAAKKLQAFIAQELKNSRCDVTEDTFQAPTPIGTLAMKNIVARFPGSGGGKAIAVTGHYDTKRVPGVKFLGANDAGSSTGFLLELARALRDRPRKNDIYLVWLDGEEAVKEWTATDSLYGSRHLAGKWAADGTLNRLIAVINVDMIGDRDLKLEDETLSSETLRRMVDQIASQSGLAKYFSGRQMPVGDDHTPFLQRGVRAIDLIDFDYGPSNAHWHTAEDTMDKLSAGSFQAVGTIVLELLKKLDQ